MDKRARVIEIVRNANKVFRCQFCGYEGKGWSNNGQTCPECGKAATAQKGYNEK